jgi:hypothetical protein
VEQRRNKIDVGCADPFAATFDLYHLTATHPAQGVDGVDAIVHHVVAGLEIGFHLALIKGALGVDNWSPLETFVAQVDDHRAGAPLEAHLRDRVVFLGQIGQHLRLVECDAHRLFDTQIQTLLETPDPNIKHNMGLADGVDGIRRHLFDHFAIVGITVLDLIAVGRCVEATLIEIADSGDLDIGERGQRGVMDIVCHTPGTNHGNMYF